MARNRNSAQLSTTRTRAKNTRLSYLGGGAVCHPRPPTRLPLAVEVVPAGDDHQRGDDGDQEHQGDPDAVQAEGVVDAQRLDPGDLLAELHAGAGPVGDQQHDRDHEGDQRDHQGQSLRRLTLDHDQRDRADQRQQGEHTQPGNHVPSLPQPSRPRAITAPTTTAPRTMVSAYDRTKPFCTLRSWPEIWVITDPVPFTAAVDAVVLQPQQTVGELLPGPHQRRLVERVAVQVVATGQGERRPALRRRQRDVLARAEDDEGDGHPDRHQQQRGDADRR